MKRWATVALAAAALLATPMATAAGIHVRLEASAPQVDATDGVVTGLLVALLQEDAGGDATNPAGFSLHAQKLRAETDSADISVHGTGTPKKVNPTTTVEEFDDATVQGTVNRQGHRWNLVPSGPNALAITVVCNVANAAGTADIVRVPLVNLQRGELRLDTRTALSWTDCHEIEASGDLQLAMWEWDGILRTSQGDRPVQTGIQASPLLPGAAGTTIVGRDVEVYLKARNATLRVPILGTTFTLLTASDASLAASSVTMTATGMLDAAGTARPLRESPLQLQSPPSATLASTSPNRPVAISVQGMAESIQIGQETLTTTTSPLATAGAWAWIGLSLLGFTTMFTYARPTLAFHMRRWRGQSIGATPATSFRERRGASYWAWGNAALRSMKWKRAERFCKRSLKLFPKSLDARLLQAMLARAQDNPHETRRRLNDLYDYLPAGKEKAGVACLLAEACVELDLPDEAVMWLQRAAREHLPTFNRELDNPAFADLDGGAWLFSMRTVNQTVAARIKGDPAFN